MRPTVRDMIKALNDESSLQKLAEQAVDGSEKLAQGVPSAISAVTPAPTAQAAAARPPVTPPAAVPVTTTLSAPATQDPIANQLPNDEESIRAKIREKSMEMAGAQCVVESNKEHMSTNEFLEPTTQDVINTPAAPAIPKGPEPEDDSGKIAAAVLQQIYDANQAKANAYLKEAQVALDAQDFGKAAQMQAAANAVAQALTPDEAETASADVLTTFVQQKQAAAGDPAPAPVAPVTPASEDADYEKMAQDLIAQGDLFGKSAGAAQAKAYIGEVEAWFASLPQGDEQATGQ